MIIPSLLINEFLINILQYPPITSTFWYFLNFEKNATPPYAFQHFKQNGWGGWSFQHLQFNLTPSSLYLSLFLSLSLPVLLPWWEQWGLFIRRLGVLPGSQYLSWRQSICTSTYKNTQNRTESESPERQPAATAKAGSAATCTGDYKRIPNPLPLAHKP